MFRWPGYLLLCLLGSAPATAQEAEIFIPGASGTIGEVTPEAPRNRLAACLRDANAENCTGVEIDPDGIALESFSGGPDITFETLTLDLNSGAVSTSAAPPPKKPDYTASSGSYRTVALPAVAITIEFDFDSATIRYDQQGKLASLAAAFQDPALAGTPFAVIGHTDASGSDGYNCDLSRRRAASVAQQLTLRYVVLPLYRVGFGENVLKNPYDPRAAENRRVTFLRLPDDYNQVLTTAAAVCPQY